MDGYHQYAGNSFDVRASRVDDKVTISIYRGSELIVEFDTSRKGALGWIAQLMKVLD
jgi:hypothetical protein